ncbi:MAG: hypothetical protein Q7R35_11335, partial [Elusimicrobiota bacterium]|nr:hypothetical protein [Elusimicrobiota bacterium]
MKSIIRAKATSWAEADDILQDGLGFYDVDFFKLELNKYEGIHRQEDIAELAALIKVLSQKIFNKDAAPISIKDVYKQTINSLP